MRHVMLTALLLASLASTASAQIGMNLRWDACLGGGGVKNRNFACDTNTGSEYLYLSFVSPEGITDITSVEIVLDVLPISAELPAWWQFRNAGSCRRNALTLSVTPGVESSGCLNAFDASSVSSFASYIQPYPGSVYQRMFMIVANPFSEVMEAPADQEMFVARVAISHEKTAGTGACPGCAVPTCVGLNQFRINRLVDQPVLRVSEETIPGSSNVTWQGASAGSYVDTHTGGNFPGPYRVLECALPVPARNQTWGSIKSLYR